MIRVTSTIPNWQTLNQTDKVISATVEVFEKHQIEIFIKFNSFYTVHSCS